MIQGDLSLRVGIADARKELERLIENGQETSDRIDGPCSFEDALSFFQAWTKRIENSLGFIFKSNPLTFDLMENHTLVHKLKERPQTNYLDTLRLNIYLTKQRMSELSELLLTTQPPSVPPALNSKVPVITPVPHPNATPDRSNGKDVFVVHGRDIAAKESVARVIEKLKLRPVILHEQANKGQTIIEKFEGHSNCAFAVVLLTPDDEGRTKPEQLDSRKKPILQNRARQNVVLELGFFMAKIGRSRVCALVKGDIERPSDIDGVVYVTMDDAGGWRTALAKEMRHAGLAVDLNDLHGG